MRCAQSFHIALAFARCLDTNSGGSMDTMSGKAWDRWFRITDVEELMPRFTGMMADYIDGPRGGDAARFAQLESLLSTVKASGRLRGNGRPRPDGHRDAGRHVTPDDRPVVCCLNFGS